MPPLLEFSAAGDTTRPPLHGSFIACSDYHKLLLKDSVYLPEINIASLRIAATVV